MEKFYTSFKSKALILFVSMGMMSTMAFGQICGNIQENFNNTGGSTVGFSGDFTHTQPGADGYLEKRNVIASGIYTITTPTFQLAATTDYIGFGFELDGSERVARVEAAVIYISTLNNQLTTVFITQFVPTYNPNSTTSDVCRAVSTSDLPGFPAGGKYRLRFELTPNTGNGQANQSINFDDFRTNGTLSLSPLPVHFIGLDAKKISGGTQLTWKVAGEENVNRYEVERSTDGRNFTSVTSVATGKKDTYTYLDAHTASTVYYRIKNVDNDGKFKYSSVARIVNGKLEIVLKAFPQPVINQLTVQHPVIKSNGLISVSTADGRIVKTIRPATGSMQTYVDMNAVQKGMYMVRFDDGEGNIETMKVLKQ
ncbi:MAG TPA: T9SS type A sorting domain-containing protein [Flavisolibacter sp.]|jgi:hypothetical protein